MDFTLTPVENGGIATPLKYLVVQDRTFDKQVNRTKYTINTRGNCRTVFSSTISRLRLGLGGYQHLLEKFLDTIQLGGKGCNFSLELGFFLFLRRLKMNIRKCTRSMQR